MNKSYLRKKIIKILLHHLKEKREEIYLKYIENIKLKNRNRNYKLKMTLLSN